MRDPRAWIPGGILAAGVVLVHTVAAPRDMALRAPLATLPVALDSLTGEDYPLTEEELAVNRATASLLRYYGTPAEAARAQLYVAYYASQGQARGIHTPKNCLPGSGWEALAAAIVPLALAGGAEVPVNRVLVAHEGERAVVYYWYQGRGRVAADEYRVKLDLLRDAALTGRTEEALVRLVVPLDPGEPEAAGDALARDLAGRLVPALARVLPG